MVADKGLKAMENHRLSGPKSGRGSLQGSSTRSSYCKAFTRIILVFWIGGRLWEVVAYKR